MKTVTEFSGFQLADALETQKEVIKELKANLKAEPAKEAPEAKEEPKVEAKPEEAPEVKADSNDPTPAEETKTEETPKSSEETKEAAPTEEAAKEEPKVEAKTEEAPKETKAEKKEEKKKPAVPKISDEDIQKAMGEKLKMEGDKLTMFMQALQMSKGKQKLKRVVVYTLDEGEKKPEKLTEKDGKVYSMEFFFVPGKEKKRDRKGSGKFAKGGRGGKGKSGKGPRRGGDRDRNRNDRRPRNPRPTGPREIKVVLKDKQVITLKTGTPQKPRPKKTVIEKKTAPVKVEKKPEEPKATPEA